MITFLKVQNFNVVTAKEVTEWVDCFPNLLIGQQNISDHVPKLLESSAKLIGEQLNQKLNSKSEALIKKNDNTVKNYEAQLEEIANPSIAKDLFRGAGLKSINRKKKTKNYFILKKSNKKKDILD